MIKKIHQIWLQGKNNIPEKYKPYISQTVELNNDWDHIIWDDKSISKECMNYSKQCFDTYNSYKHLHQKVDLGRYVILYNNGGISVDMDAKAVKSFNTIPGLNDNKMIVSSLNINRFLCFLFCQKYYMVNNAHIYSPKHNKSLKKIIDSLISTKIYNTTKEVDIICTTGPLNFTKLIDNDVKIIDYKYFEPLSTGDNTVYDETIIVHDTHSTWLNPFWKTIYSVYKSADNVTVISIFILFTVTVLLLYHNCTI